MAMSHMAPGWVTCHPFNEAFASAGKGPISPDRAIGHNGEQILIFEIAVAAKRRELAPFRQRRSFPGRYLTGGVNGKTEMS
jgi:hypothetical protein